MGGSHSRDPTQQDASPHLRTFKVFRPFLDAHPSRHLAHRRQQRQTAHRIATENQWPAPHELLLYIIHGMLHVIGLEDTTESQAKKMRAQEKYYLEAILGDSTVCKEAR